MIEILLSILRNFYWYLVLSFQHKKKIKLFYSSKTKKEILNLDIYADYLRQAEPRTESRMGGTRIKKFHGRYVKVYGPYQRGPKSSEYAR